jgi:hypothetical protein
MPAPPVVADTTDGPDQRQPTNAAPVSNGETRHRFGM